MIKSAWLRAAVAAAAALGLLTSTAWAREADRPVAAGGGSIVYVSAGNIWAAASDGSGRRQITHNGSGANPYRSVTQADNGTVEAIRGYTTLVRVNRAGKSLGPAIKVASGPNNNFSLHTLAMDAALSPNGRYVATSILEYQGLYDPSTGGKAAGIIAEDIYYLDAQTGKQIGKTHAAGTYFMSPSWMDNTHALIFAPYNISADQVIVDERNRPGWAWFADGGALDFSRQDLDHGELTRQRDKLALIRGTNLKNDWRGATIQVYAVSSLHTEPAKLCSISAQHGAFGKPTWSPDGTMLAWSDSNGVWESAIQPGAANCGLAPKLVIRGGSNPDWGPAAP